METLRNIHKNHLLTGLSESKKVLQLIKDELQGVRTIGFGGQ